MNLRRFLVAVLVSFGFVLTILPAQAQVTNDNFQLVPFPTGTGACLQAKLCNPDDGANCVCTAGKCPTYTLSTDQLANYRPVECDYTFCDMIRILTNASQIIFGFSGGLALVYFLYGGFFLIVSGWYPDGIKKGTLAMKEAIFGLICVIVAYQFIGIVALVMVNRGTDNKFTFTNGYLLFTQNNWAKLSEGCRISLIQKPAPNSSATPATAPSTR